MRASMQICLLGLLACLTPLVALKVNTLDDVTGKDPWSAMEGALKEVESEELVDASEAGSVEAPTWSRGAVRRGGGTGRPAAGAADVIAMTKALEQISSMTTKPLCMHFAKAQKAKNVEDLVSDFDVICSNIMNHRRGLVGETIVAAPVGKMACAHTHSYLQTVKAPTDLVKPSSAEMCAVYQDMVSGAVAHLSQEDRLSETLQQIGAARKRKAETMNMSKRMRKGEGANLYSRFKLNADGTMVF